MHQFTFAFHHPITRSYISDLRLKDVSFNTPLSGIGEFNGTYVLRPEDDTYTVAAATQPDESAVYVYAEGQLIWGGVVVSRIEKVETREIKIKALSWKSWAYSKILGPNTDSTYTETTFAYTNKDQLYIAQQLTNIAVADVGTPAIQTDQSTSGVNRDLNFHGSDFKTLGEQIDSMAKRDNGFEWDLVPILGFDGVPYVWLKTYYPERGSGADIGLTFSQKNNGFTNILATGDWEESSLDRGNRIWATGSVIDGQVTAIRAVDQDPLVTADSTLIRERRTSYPSVNTTATLAAHARGELAARKTNTNYFDIVVQIDDPDVNSYTTGDRAMLIREGLLGITTVNNARVIDRKILPDIQQVQLKLDVFDNELPTE